MIAEDYEQFRSLLADVHAFYDRDLSDFALDVWWAALRPYELSTINRAFGKHTTNPDTGQYLPKPADVVRMIAGRTQDSALQAWSKVDRAVRTIGVYESVVFDDALIHRVLEDMGGWIALGMKGEDEWPFIAKEFEGRYRAYAMRKDSGEYQQVLIGVNEAQNNRSGFKSMPPLLLGDEQQCLKVLSGGAEKVSRAKRLATDAVRHLQLVHSAG